MNIPLRERNDDAEFVDRIDDPLGVGGFEGGLLLGREVEAGEIVVTEGQLNSFVNLTLAEKIPPEMSDLELDLRQDRLGARVRLDLDQLRAKMPQGGPASLLSMLTGVVPVELSGRVESAEGPDEPGPRSRARPSAAPAGSV